MFLVFYTFLTRNLISIPKLNYLQMQATIDKFVCRLVGENSEVFKGSHIEILYRLNVVINCSFANIVDFKNTFILCLCHIGKKCFWMGGLYNPTFKCLAVLQTSRQCVIQDALNNFDLFIEYLLV